MASGLLNASISPRPRRRRVLSSVLVFCLLSATLLALPRGADAATTVSDDFNRANGGLGTNWTAMSDGGLTIASQAVVGSSAGYSGSVRTGESYAGDQSSQIQLTGTKLSGSQWVGAGVRAQNGGRSLYVGLYWWNSGRPVLILYKRVNGNWTQLGSTYASGALPAGTQLRLAVAGSTLTFSQNNVARITVTDSTLTGGAPAVMAYGKPTADNWQGTGVATSVTTYSVGGTVSGLSGTVMLQDNGGDDLTVTANGAFSFATRLATGAAYAVTVKTNAAGQTCTVANGTGTITTANVTSVSVSCTAAATGSPSDDFNRANGGLGANWTAMTDGGLAIASQAVVGSSAGYSGNIRTGESYAGDQSSQIQLTGTQLTGSQWVGAGVRAQAGGQSVYVGLYWWNSGSPVLMLFKRINGNWSQLGSTYASGALPAGTQLRLAVAGSTLTFSQNGVARITVTDSTLTGGAPAVMAYGKPTADNWQGTGVATSVTTYSVGGTVSGLSGTVVLRDNGGDDLTVTANGVFSFATRLATGAAYAVTVKTNPAGQTCTVANGTGTISTANVTNVNVSCTGAAALGVQFVGTDANGVETYNVTSANNGPGAQTLRVLRPTHPAAGVAHNFLYALPVGPLLDTSFGDPMTTLESLDAQDQYNLTIIVPSFGTEPWYADNPLDPSEQYEAFMASELQPWAKANLSTSGQEQHWLMGFSKSGIGGQDLLLKHPDRFTLAASWDFPADMSTYDQFGANSADNYGTDANFQANYRLTPSFVDAHKLPFLTNNRIWIGGYNVFQQDILDYGALLTSEGLAHTTGTLALAAHRWDSGWVPEALAALYQDSVNQH